VLTITLTQAVLAFHLPAQPREKPRRYAVLAIFPHSSLNSGKIVASQSQAGGGLKKVKKI